MSDRNNSTNMKALLQFEDPKDQPERGRDHRSINGSRREESSSSGSLSHCETCSCSGHSSSLRPASPSPGHSSPRPRSSSPSMRPSSPRSTSPRPGPSSPSFMRSSSPRSSSPGPRPSSPSSFWPLDEQAEGGECVERQKKDRSSSSYSLSELKRLPDCQTNELERLSFSMTHTVLVDVNVFFCERKLMPQTGRDMWHSNFVKMPCSQASVINTKTAMFTGQAVRWETIHKQLTRLSKKSAVSVSDVEEAILKYNPKYKGQWSFDALANFVKCVPKTDNYFSALFPKIAALALELPNFVKKAIPMLQKGRTASITLSQVQISCLLANAFFCTFPHRNTTNPKAEYSNFPSINFNSLFGGSSQQKSQKLRAIMHYFKVVTDPETRPQGLVTFERRVLSENPDWRNCKEKMPKLHITEHGNIENEGTGMLQVDFACKRIGGGVLGSGLVQEEILFLMNPELILSRLFTEKLEDNECLIVIGSQQFSNYSGYGDTFEWAGPYDDITPRDEWKRRHRQILAIDALFYRHSWEQYNKLKVRRELNKAYCGFKVHGPNKPDKPDIATGKWGCGAFHGDPQLKAVIQLMAAAMAKRGLAFFTFDDKKLKEELQELYHLLVTEGTTVGTLFNLVETFCEKHQASPHLDLFGFIGKTLKTSRGQL